MLEMELLLKEKKNNIEQMIYPYLDIKDGYNDTLVEAMAYSYKAGGKRLRPLIIMSVFEMLSDPLVMDITPYMAGMEMIHTYSLIHDDLPSMDNDDLRRGKPTCHKVYGEAMAILAGDGLLNLAFEVMIEDVDKYPTTQRIQAAKTIIKAAGARGMVGGQVVDIRSDDHGVSKEILSYIHDHKTGALLQASFLCGGYLAGANSDTIDKLGQIGQAIGLAFQIQDDILDVIGSEKELGKPLMSDAKNNKATYVTFNGLTESKRIMKDLLNKGISLLTEIEPEKSKFLQNLVLYLGDRNY